MVEKAEPFRKIGMVGVGSMGSMMALLLADHGHQVYYFDPNEKSVKALRQHISKLGLKDQVISRCNSKDLCWDLKREDQPRILIISTPHGSAIDNAVKELRPYLDEGDIIIDCANEYYENTERRQKELEPRGIHYIGCGVSGGFQSAQSGPSFSPGGDRKTLMKLMPLLEKVAAKDRRGKPCTAPVGPGSSGHYTKMVHNGIKQGIMSAIAEAWLILVRGMGLTYSEASDVFRSWNQSGPLEGCFLISIGAGINKAKGKTGDNVLGHVRDKVVQDVDEREGTGTWACEEAISQHIPAATILSAHLFRCASADVVRREVNNAASEGGTRPRAFSVSSKDDFILALEKTVHFCFLTSFAQGLDILGAKDQSMGWNLNFSNVLQLWRGGAIIEADQVIDLLDHMYQRSDHNREDVLSNHEVSGELKRHALYVKEVVLKAIETDMFVPCISQSLEYYKYSTATDLPTQFMEAQLDYFGEHMFEQEGGSARRT